MILYDRKSPDWIFCYLYWFCVSHQAIEGDCDVVLKKVGGALTVLAFKCKTDGKTLSHSTWHPHTFRSCQKCHSIDKNLHASFFDDRIHGRPVCWLCYPPSPKWHRSPGLCPSLFGNLQQQDCECNIRCKGGWKDVIKGGPRNCLVQSSINVCFK